MTNTLLSDDDVALLNEPHLAYVATVMADGSPQITPVWVDTDGEHVLFNTAAGRVKTRNLERNPSVAVLVADENDAYRWVGVRGTAEIVEEGADAHIDKLAKKYLGADSYPWRNPAEQRVIVRVTPAHKTLPPR
jgi:PPOX class probable F420-dependent enzyme